MWVCTVGTNTYIKSYLASVFLGHSIITIEKWNMTNVLNVSELVTNLHFEVIG